MNLFVLNTDFEAIWVMDTYESLIWTDRYNEYGDFEIYAPMTDDILTHIQQDYYLVNSDSEHVMIIEKLQISSDVEEGNKLKITGRSLESILDRRIVWKLRSFSSGKTLQYVIKCLINENIIEPTNSKRVIDNFVFESSTDTAITSLTLDAVQYTGDNIYDVITSLCSEYEIGFKVTLNDSNQFVFQLYAGTDRSYDQSENPYVIFSPKFENIVNSNYIESKSALKNVTLIGGEGEGSSRRYTTVGSITGMDRRELFTDARDISSDVDGETLSTSEYKLLLRQRGKENLAENVEVVSFEGEVEATQMFVYGEDFFIGDIVHVANEYGHSTKVRVVEFVRSEEEDGISTYPTFSTITDTDYGEDDEEED